MPRLVSVPRVVAVAQGSPAESAGLLPGDELIAISGRSPRDVLEYQWLMDEADPTLTVSRGGLEIEMEISKTNGQPLGAEIDSPLFDRVRTCDNHCDFCFIYQLPKGMRKSLYMKDDDYRLSFLYGNFTTLTRFTEADLERVIEERLSPLFVSIHATDPPVRRQMLGNRRGASSSTMAESLLDHGTEVHGQVVVCPGINDAEILKTRCLVCSTSFQSCPRCVWSHLASAASPPRVPLRAHTKEEAPGMFCAWSRNGKGGF